MTLRKNVAAISVITALFIIAGCQMPTQEPANRTTGTAETGNENMQPAGTGVLPGDAEKALPSEAPSNLMEETGSNPSEEGDLGSASAQDMEQMRKAYDEQNPSLCQQIEAETLREVCLENLQGAQSAEDTTENDRQTEASYQEYGDTTEPEVSAEEQPAV